MKKKKNTLFADILQSITRYFLVLVAAVVIMICVSGIRVVKSGEVALILRFGKLVGDTYEEQVHEPGLLFAFPYIIDEVITVPTGNVMEQVVTTHYTSGPMTSLRSNGYVITGDQNIAVISASVKYVISDPVAYALHVKSIPDTINAFVSTAMVNEAAGMTADTLLTSGKDAFAKAVMERAQAKLSLVEAGVTIGTLELTTVAMPSEVRDTYEMVTSAMVSANTQIEQAKQYRENLLPQAKAQADTLISNANAAYSGAVAAANADLAEFWGVLEEYKVNPDVVRTRIYSAKVSETIAKIGKVYVVQDGQTKIVIN
jgi:membrane protease subunit HflK